MAHLDASDGRGYRAATDRPTAPRDRRVAPFLVRLPATRLAAFGDRTILRDPRARTRRPSLLPDGDAWVLGGPFEVRRHLVVPRARGVRFAEATGDPNPIHREGDVVPGAFLAAQTVGTLEALFPTLRLESLRVSFTGIAWYDRSLRLAIRCAPTIAPGGAPGLTAQATAWQDEREVSSAVVEARFEPDARRVDLPLASVDQGWLGRVLECFQSLGIDPQAWLVKPGGPDLSYPLAFLASLPSGSMVQRFQGDGGVLNRLTFEFNRAKLPLAGPPEVSVELPSRLRQSFTKILTFVKEGVETALRGTALVLPRPPADLLRRGPAPT